MSTGTPERPAVLTAAVAPMGAPSGIFNGLERSTVAMMAPPAEVNEAAAGPPPTVDEGSAVVVVLVTPISTASASMRFRLELEER